MEQPQRAAHTVTAEGGAFDSGLLAEGASFRHRFTQPGTVSYRCLLHDGMRGTVTVGQRPAVPSAGADGAQSSAPAPRGGTAGAPTLGGASRRGSGSRGVPGPQIAAASTVDVEVRDFAFAPPDVSVPAGSAVRWELVGAAPHTVTADDGSFDSGMLEAGATYTQTFDTPGTVEYRCTFHPEMVGTVTVTSAGAGPGDGGTGQSWGADGAAAGAGGPGSTSRTASVLADTGGRSVALALVMVLALLAAGAVFAWSRRREVH